MVSLKFAIFAGTIYHCYGDTGLCGIVLIMVKFPSNEKHLGVSRTILSLWKMIKIDKTLSIGHFYFIYIYIIHSPATLLGIPVQLLGNTNQPITWQQLNGFRHLDMVKTTRWSWNWASERGFKWLILNVEWLFLPDRLVWVFQKLLILKLNSKLNTDNYLKL